MKLKSTFVTQMIGDEYIMVPVDDNSFRGVIRTNKTAAYIVECLKDGISFEGAVQKVLEKYDVVYDVAFRDVNDIVTKLRAIQAFEEE